MIVTRPGVSVAGSAVSLGTVPPGPGAVVITNAGAVTLFVGAGPVTGGTVSTSTGTPVPGPGVVPLPGYPGSSAVGLYGITAGGTVTAGVFISGPG